MDYTHSRYYNPALTGLAQITHSVDQLLKVTNYLPENEQQQLVDCCFYAAEAHKEDLRSSGEPFICHPIKVAEILAREVQFDLPVLQAGVLHDVIEDTAVSKSDVIELYGQEVADLVDGVTKLRKGKGMSRQELQALTFQKLTIAMEADPRVVMIKFADRVHNMQTISALRVDKQRIIAKETLEVYAPIAGRLGMAVFKNTLEELAFQTLHPLRSKLINSFIDQTHERREDEFLAVQEELSQRFQSAGINAHVRKRRRSACTIHNKMKAGKANKKSLKNAGLPLIVITETRDECYRVLGIIHELYKPIASKLKDYIALNKSNGYQSIHTTVLSENRALNFQIRTRDMHTVAESGIIGLWRHNHKNQSDMPIRQWLSGIRELSKIETNCQEFYNAVKRDMNEPAIEVLTAGYDPLILPQGATVIDFAYRIHSSLGNHLINAHVNGVQVPIDQRLHNGQIVEVFTGENITPKPYWLKNVKTANARASIRHCLRNLPADYLTNYGRDSLQQYLEENNLNVEQLGNFDELLDSVAKGYGIQSDELLQRIALHYVNHDDIFKEIEKLARKQRKIIDIAFEVLNRTGVLADLAETMKQYHANIVDMKYEQNLRAEIANLFFSLEIGSQKQYFDMMEDLETKPYVERVFITS